MEVADDPATPSSFTIRRRNSIGTPIPLTVPTDHHHHSPPPSFSSSFTATTTTTTSSASSSSSADFELVSIKPACYTSLRDILPSPAAAVHSPSFAPHSGHEISIRNRLVKQAAWAYLQPMSISPESDGPTFFHRLWTRFSDVFFRLVSRAFDCLLRSIQVTTNTSRL